MSYIHFADGYSSSVDEELIDVTRLPSWKSFADFPPRVTASIGCSSSLILIYDIDSGFAIFI
jgi:hypothetical protein